MSQPLTMLRKGAAVRSGRERRRGEGSGREVAPTLTLFALRTRPLHEARDTYIGSGHHNNGHYGHQTAIDTANTKQRPHITSRREQASATSHSPQMTNARCARLHKRTRHTHSFRQVWVSSMWTGATACHPVQLACRGLGSDLMQSGLPSEISWHRGAKRGRNSGT